jgi:ribonucleoside-diphosphate reductase alpha chain
MKVSFDEVLRMVAEGEFDKYEKTIKSYYDLMVNQRYLPNTPCIVNAGRRLGNLAACYTLPVEDNLDSIMETAKNMSKIHQSGGGTGFNYSKLREKGARISSTSGTSSGPVSFMEIVNCITDVVKSGGVRRGANMSILESQSPDILEFIHVKETPGVLENFNISVGIDGKFWECYKDNKPYELISPHTGKVKGTINPRDLINQIATSAHKSAEPGCLFFDNANRYHVMKDLKGEINVTNPCSEQYLFPYESCNLGSINLSKFVKNKIFDFDSFEKTVRICVDFLDNVVDINKYPIPEIDNESWKTRRIGLGCMGLADMLFAMEIPYNSEEAYKVMEQIAQFMIYKSVERSVELAKTRGSFPYYNQTLCKEGKLDIAGLYEGSITDIIILKWKDLQKQIKNVGLRNVYITTQAPTGSISMIADCSSGIEPLFALAFEKKVAVGDFTYINPYLEKYLKDNNIEYNESTLKKIAKSGSCQNSELPDKVKRIFVTAMDIHWIDHVMAQSIFQRWIDNSISKTINFANNATVDDILNSYIFAHEMGCKGLSVYRDRSRHQQVLYTEDIENKNVTSSEFALNLFNSKIQNQIMIMSSPPSQVQTTLNVSRSLDPETTCPDCKIPYVFQEGCFKCPNCIRGGCST